MAIHVVRLGAPRGSREGLRIGTVRRPPRGVPKQDYARRDFYDVWLPELAPSQELVSWGLSEPWTEKRWAAFARRYAAEMRRPEAQHLLALLAALSHAADISVGCYCEDESRCHRSLLRELLAGSGAAMAE
jgi:uncharacterized protein YeaO (DUF488 family)